MLLLNIVEYEEAFFPGLVIKDKKKTIAPQVLRRFRLKKILHENSHRYIKGTC